MASDIAIMVACVVVILVLADLIIDHATGLARHYGVSGSFVGLTVLSIGTSIPEIMAHVVGSVTILRDPSRFDAMSGLLLGANLGSDVFQQNFVLPVVGLVGTIVVIRKELYREVGTMVAAYVLLWVLSADSRIGRPDGLLLVAAYGIYLGYLYHSEGGNQALPVEESAHRSPARSILVLLGGFAAIAVATEQVVSRATEVVAQLPISASLFGVVFLGVATALPELTTSLISIRRGRRDISAGILIGSNITNPLFCLGVGAVISGYSVPSVAVLYDLPFKIATSLLLFTFLVRREDLNRREAVALIALFVVYVVVRGALFPEDVHAPVG